jgi:hypothetical protein
VSVKENRPLGLRLLNTLCAFSLLGVVGWGLVAGLDFVFVGIAVLALGAISVSPTVSANGFLDVIGGILEAVVEGIVGVFEVIADVFSSIF